MWIALALAWWAAGTAGMLWLTRACDLTWGQLLFCMFAGLIGPALWVMMGFAILCQAEFWSKPIFPSKKPHTIDPEGG